MQRNMAVSVSAIRQQVIDVDGEEIAKHIEGDVDSVRLVLHFRPEDRRPVTRTIILPVYLFPSSQRY